MKANDIFDLGAGLLLVALVTRVVTSRNVAGQITATGNALSNLVQSALGKGTVGSRV